ncbi:MAG: hypothetical protein JWM47_834 [Acidimicrobiales bacterium]|nr:hypothetical protein [Acidimicrobiales bacterium]
MTTTAIRIIEPPMNPPDGRRRPNTGALDSTRHDPTKESNDARR